MNLNKKIFNWAAWITLIATYILPYQSTDGFATKFGYPFSFLTIYGTHINVSLLKSLSLNPLILIIDVVIVYLLIKLAYKLLEKTKFIKTKTVEENTK